MGMIIILYLAVPTDDLLKSRDISLLVSSFPGVLVTLLLLASLLAFVIGLTGYQANFIQLGLDQLFEAPSHHLSLFIHYATWSFNIEMTMVTVLNTLNWCVHKKSIFITTTMLSYLVILLILLLVSCCKYCWFSTNTGHPNPYKTVYKVISFARKYNYPLQRSAFTFHFTFGLLSSISVTESLGHSLG